ncbi:hypothetical protein N9V50_05115, partial [Flavobacteriaceae bacterium]|nr:hypothetical protein [Flavobacteriaceae bacterium]
MSVRKLKPITPGQRFRVVNGYDAITTDKPEKSLLAPNKRSGGRNKQVYTYWGDQLIVEAPAYIGAVIIFLFFLGIFLVKGKFKHWLVASTVFSILMSWGKNFELLTNFFIDYIPLY